MQIKVHKSRLLTGVVTNLKIHSKDALTTSSELLQEAQLIFDVLVPPPESIQPKTSSSVNEIILRRRVKVKLTDSNNELKRELDGIMKSLAKLERKMSRWISEENDFDELESLGLTLFLAEYGN